MPYGDRTGPWGQGPMTGRRAGYCAGYDRPGYASQGMGRGFGMGYGRGMGRGRGPGRGFGQGYGRGPGFYGPTSEPPDPRFIPVYKEPSPEEEKVYLEKLVKDLEAELGDVKARMKELTKKEK
ncbi:MAG: DUF5320 domain-containing protein [Thermoplasmata archaeon]|nr:DUF5320 domain-containing protein [Thermoplasmata archaeon]